jgi:small subunit ribosomal protein S6
MNAEYELVTVAREDLSEEARGQLIDQIKKIIESEKGEILSVSDWGRRELAYEIKKNTHGFYTLITFRAGPKTANLLNSKIKIMEELLRHLIVKKEDKK